MKNTPDKILLLGWAFVLLIPPFRYRIYACFNKSLSIPTELIISVVFYLCIFSLLLLHTKLTKDSESIKMTCVAAFIALIFARFTSWSIGHGIENRFFYDSMEARNGMVYTSYVNEYNAYGGRVGPHAYVTLTNRNKSTKKIHGKYSEGNTVLVSFPELPNEFEPYHYSIYGTMCYEDNPNKLQIEYCMGGVKMSNKIRSLKMEYPSPKQVKMFQQWYQTYSSHTKIIAAVIEKKGDKHSFINATQSDDKLWAYEGTSPKIGQKVLVAYHVNNPNLYYVYNWSPTEEDYQFYNKKEGLSPFEKYKDLINEEITKNE